MICTCIVACLILNSLTILDDPTTRHWPRAVGNAHPPLPIYYWTDFMPVVVVIHQMVL